jgi:hypothetical protein
MHHQPQQFALGHSAVPKCVLLIQTPSGLVGERN